MSNMDEHYAHVAGIHAANNGPVVSPLSPIPGHPSALGGHARPDNRAGKRGANVNTSRRGPSLRVGK
jgi:hypothetical protein